jgi:hypothetical protein
LIKKNEILHNNEGRKNLTLRRNNQILVLKVTELLLQNVDTNMMMIVPNPKDPMLPKAIYKNCMKI